MHGEIKGFFIIIHKTNKEALTVFCSFTSDALKGSGWSTQEVGRNTPLCLVFPLHFFCAQAPSCMLYKEQLRLLYLLNISLIVLHVGLSKRLSHQ